MDQPTGGDAPTTEAQRLLFTSRDGLELSTKIQVTARLGVEWVDFTGPVIAIEKGTEFVDDVPTCEEVEIARGRVINSRTCALGMVTIDEIERMGDVAQRNPIGFGIAMERFYPGITIEYYVTVLAFELTTPTDGFGDTAAPAAGDGAENAEG